jgi:hypothetical protein
MGFGEGDERGGDGASRQACPRSSAIGPAVTGGIRAHPVGRRGSYSRQRVGNRPTQVANRFVGEERPRACEPIDTRIQRSQRLGQSRDLGLKDRIFSSLAQGLPQRADIRPQALEIRQHAFGREIDF